MAKSLAIDPSILSRAMSGSRALSSDMAQRIASALRMSGRERKIFVESAAVDRPRAAREKGPSGGSAPYGVSTDRFRTIADWYHYAILDLTFVDDADMSPRAIARRFGLTVIEVQDALGRLLNMGLLERTLSGRYRKTTADLVTDSVEITSEAHKKHQRQILRKALDALSCAPIERRNLTSVIMAIDPKKIPVAKIMIQKFLQDLCEFLEDGARKEMYASAVQLFSLEPKATNAKPRRPS